MLLGLALVGGIGALLAWLFAFFPLPFNWLAIAPVLKTILSLHGLDRASGEVQLRRPDGNYTRSQICTAQG